MRQLLFVLGLFSVLSVSYAAESASDELVRLIVGLIGNSDREFRAAGLDQLRTSAKGAAATRTFAALLSKLDTEGQVALLSALADRKDVAAHPAVLELLSSSKAESVRASAIDAIGSLGSATDLPLLFKSLASASTLEQEAVKRCLIRLSGEAISKAIAAEAKTASPAAKSALIEVLATRRASDEIPAFLAAAIDDNAQVRAAAMSAIGQLGRPEHIAPMLAGVLKAQKGTERDGAERNVAQVCARIENEDQRGSKLIEAINTTSDSEKDELLPLVGRVGGAKLVSFVAAIATGENPARRLIGIDALSKWPDASVADKLLEIVNQASNPAERHQAVQAFIKICSTRDNRSDKQRLERMKEAMKIAQTAEEHTYVINRTRTAYDVDAMRFILPYVDQPDFAQIACETIVEIAHHRAVRDPHKEEFDKVLDKVIEVSKDPVVIDRAQRYKRGETWERPKK